MVTVTEAAREELLLILESSGAQEPGVGLRMVPDQQGNIGLVLDTEKEDDQVVEHEGARVLLVDGEVSRALKGWIVDYQDHPEGRRLVVIRE